MGENEEKTERSPEKKEIKREEKKSMAPPRRGLERPTTIFIHDQPPSRRQSSSLLFTGLHERAILPDEATGRCKRLDWTTLERARKAETLQTALGWELGIAGIGVIGRCALKILGPFGVSYIPPPPGYSAFYPLSIGPEGTPKRLRPTTANDQTQSLLIGLQLK